MTSNRSTCKQEVLKSSFETVKWHVQSAQSGRRLFQTRGPAAGKLLSPNCADVRGTTQVLMSEEWSWRRQSLILGSSRQPGTRVLDRSMPGKQSQRSWTKFFGRLATSATDGVLGWYAHSVLYRWQDVLQRSGLTAGVWSKAISHKKALLLQGSTVRCRNKANII